MVQFNIQPDSEIPASTQLFNQIRFAIASRQYAPGDQLPSTRALAMRTGLHRNTISKVYRQLEDIGLVTAEAGSGIYVRDEDHEGVGRLKSPMLEKYPQAYKIVQRCLDELLKEGCSLNQARELVLTEIDWRLRCSTRVIVTAPTLDIGAGQLMAHEVEKALGIPVQLVRIEELSKALDLAPSGTVVTSRYFIGAAEAIAAPKSVRVLPIDIYDFVQESQIVKSLPKDSCIGLVSLSPGIMRAAEVIVHSLRGEEIMVISALRDDAYKLNALVRSARVIFCDPASLNTVKAAISTARDEIIRPPQVVGIENYIDTKSINMLKRELGLD